MKIPVILNNRNLLTYPKQMVEDLKTFENIGEIYIIDNGSTYEPLLEWYETKPCNIVKTGNMGHHSPWVIGLTKTLDSDYYVVTDSDLDLSLTPKDSLNYLVDKLEKHTGYDKIGLSLSNWDVPINSPYHEFLKIWANTNWDINSVNDGLLVNQRVDTTFAIYHQKRNYLGHSCATYSPYSVKHIPWEFTHDILDNLKTQNYEYYHYLVNSNSSSSYKQFINFKP